MNLSNRLRSEGVDCNIDQYIDSPDEGWPRWMQNEIEKSDFVLVVCTEIYERRFLGKEEPKKGLGVTWEGAILTQELYDAASKNSKFIPVILSPNDSPFIPVYLKSATRYLLDNEGEYDTLYARLTSQEVVSKPELGDLRQIKKESKVCKPVEKSLSGKSSESKKKPVLGELHQVQVSPTKSNIPYSPNPYFTGRDEELEEIRKLLLTQKTVALSQPVAVYGLGGIGKTQTAIEYSHRFFKEYEFVFWVKADFEDSIVSDYTAIAKLLNLPVKEDADQNLIASVVLNWLNTNDNWLLVFDNADNPDIIKPFLSRNLHGHVLLTSRAQIFDTLGITNPIRINKMLPEEAFDFFLRRTGRKDLDDKEVDSLKKIIQELDCLPLAIEQAGAYIHKMQCSFNEYLASYKIRGLRLLEQSRISTDKYPESVATTWLLNFEEIKDTSSVSVDLLFASAFLHCDKIPFDIFIKGHEMLGDNIASTLQEAQEDPLVFHEIIEPLAQFSLISINWNNRTYDIHRLVQTVIKEGVDESVQHLWAERVVKAINLIFPEVEFENWDLCDRLLSHALACSNLIYMLSLELEESAALLNSIGEYLNDRGRFAECESALTRSLEIRQKVLDTKHPDVAESLNNLANLYLAQGKYSKAEPLFVQSLNIREKILASEHPDVAESLNNLAILYQDQGKYSEAEPLHVKSLEMREKILGSEHPDVAESLNNLASLYQDQGRYSEAEPLYVKSLEIRDKILDAKHPGVAASLNNLANLYQDQGRYPEAESLYIKSLEIDENVLGPEHPAVATGFNNLAGLYQDQGRYSEAEPLLIQSLEIRENVLGLEHPDIAMSFNNLASLYYNQGEYSKAEPLFIQSLEITERVFGSEHPDVATRLNNLAGLYHDQGKYSEAETLYIRSLETRKKMLGPEHPDIVSSCNNLAGLYREKREYPKAKDLYVQAISIIDKNQIENYPNSLICLDNYAYLLQKMGMGRKSVQIRNRTKKIRRKNKITVNKSRK